MESKDLLLKMPVPIRATLMVELGYATGKSKSDAIQFSIVHKVPLYIPHPPFVHYHFCASAQLMRKYVVLGVVPTLCAASTTAFGRPCPYTNVTPISPRKVPFLADLDNASLIRISLKLCYERFSYLALDELEDQDDFSARDNQMMMVSSADPSS